MGDKDDVVEFFCFEDAEQVGDVHLEVDGRAEQVPSLPQAGQCRGEDLVPGRPQPRCDTLPAPSAVTAAVEQDEWGFSCHRGPSTVRTRRP
ncbi:hypothetical protein GCM10022382_14460 [Microbacterium invictum]